MNDRRFVARTVVGRSPEETFAWLADHRNVPRALDGVSRWEPLGRADGTGARFDVEMNVFGFPLRAVLVLDRWDPPVALGWHSRSGVVEQRGLWRLRAVPAGCEVTLEISYRPPGGLAGNLLASRADGVVRDRLERALTRMRNTLAEGQDR